MINFIKTYILIMLFAISGCGDNSDRGLLDNGSSQLDLTAVNLAVTPKVSRISVGIDQQLEAEAELEDGTIVNVTRNNGVSWESSNQSIATVDSFGKVTGVKEGVVTITAIGVNNDASELRDEATIFIGDDVPVALVVTPKTTTVANGISVSFKAELLSSNGQVFDVTNNANLSWSSSEERVATISNTAENKGVAQTNAVGNTSIQASITIQSKTISDSATLNVTNHEITEYIVTPSVATSPVGLEVEFFAEAIFSDGTRQDVTNDSTWASSNNNIAIIDNTPGSKGVAIGITESGSTPIVIEASFGLNGTEYKDTAHLTITPAEITDFFITPLSSEIPIGLSNNYKASVALSDGQVIDVTNNSDTSWTSSNGTVASVSNNIDSKGLVSGNSTGSASINAVFTQNGITFRDSADVIVVDAVISEIRVTPPSTEVPVGLETRYVATAIMSDGSSEVVTEEENISWSSSNTDVATISNDTSLKGVATGISVGNVVITATDNSNQTMVTGSADLIVTEAVISELQVTPPNAEVPVGISQQFIATAILSDNSTIDVTNSSALDWTSSNSNIASINNIDRKGEALGESTGGPVNITATIGTVKGMASMTVTKAEVDMFEVTPEIETTPVGTSVSFTANAIFTDGSIIDVTNDPALSWVSSDPNISSITSGELFNNGVATGNDIGQVTIVASGAVTGKTFTDTAILNVTDAIATRILVTPTDGSISVAQQINFNAQLEFSDGSSTDITDAPETEWVIGNPSIATVSSQQPSNNGLVTGVSVGNTTVNTTFNSLIGQANLQVTQAALTTIEVEPDPLTVGVNQSNNLIAEGVFSDGTRSDITDIVDWTGQDIAIATIESGINNGGRVTGVSSGSTTTIATADDGYGATVNSLPATINVVRSIETIEATPENVYVTKVTDGQFNAVGTYSDGAVEDVSGLVTWNVEDESIATIFNGTNFGGLVNAGSTEGSSNVTAELDGVVSNVVTVTSCGDFSGPCIDTFDIGDGTIYTNSPSVSYLDLIGGAPNSGTFTNENSVNGPSGGVYYIFTFDQAEILCALYNEQELAKRTNWRVITLDEGQTLQSFGSEYRARTWEVGQQMWTSDPIAEGDGRNFTINPATTQTFERDRALPYLVTCISTP